MPRPNFTNSNNIIKEIIRVNHAGEYGAKRIYAGQLKFTKDFEDYIVIKHMLQQEEVHLDYFTKQLLKRRIRPTCLISFWDIAGYMLGSWSVLMGIKTAMIVTKSVEEVIEQHYQKQIDYLQDLDIEAELLHDIKQFQLDEMAHKDIALTYRGEKLLFTPLITKIVKLTCNIAINLSKKI